MHIAHILRVCGARTRIVVFAPAYAPTQSHFFFQIFFLLIYIDFKDFMEMRRTSEDVRTHPYQKSVARMHPHAPFQSTFRSTRMHISKAPSAPECTKIAARTHVSLRL